MHDFLKYVNPIFVVVVTTNLAALLFLDKKKQRNKYLISILGTNFITEIAAMLLLINHRSIDLLYSTSYIIHHSLWIILIGNFLTEKK